MFFSFYCFDAIGGGCYPDYASRTAYSDTGCRCTERLSR